MSIQERSSKIKSCVYKKISKFQYDAKTGNSGYKAELAELRRGVDHIPGNLAKPTGIVLKTIPEEFYGKGNNPSYEEWAVYIALTLFAVHQQGNDPANSIMHHQGQTLGKAIALLGYGENDKERIIKKVTALISSSDIRELSYYLKTFIYLLRNKNISLDYVSLTDDLYKFQISGYSDSIRLKWGRDFYSNLFPSEVEEEKELSNEPE